MTHVMSADQWQVLCEVEKHWLKKNELLDLTKLAAKLHLNPVELVEALSSPLLKQSFEARGIPLYTDTDQDLTPVQVACINLILNVADRRTLKDKLNSLGVKPSTYYGWKKQKHFADVLRDQGEKLFGNNQAEVHAALTKAALEGDTNAIKYWNQLSGRFDPSKTVEGVNVRYVMQALLEVIQTHVHDEDTLRAISDGFMAVLDIPGAPRAINQ